MEYTAVQKIYCGVQGFKTEGTPLLCTPAYVTINP